MSKTLSNTPCSTAVASQLAAKTSDAYSADRYGKQWVNCAALLLKAEFTPEQAEQILRSKYMRWAADAAVTENCTARFISFAAELAQNCATMKAEAQRWCEEV